jgi:hypothetical protein
MVHPPLDCLVNKGFEFVPLLKYNLDSHDPNFIFPHGNRLVALAKRRKPKAQLPNLPHGEAASGRTQLPNGKNADAEK